MLKDTKLYVEGGEELFNYQIGGAKWLARQRYALLADEAGLGKSAQAIRAADLLQLSPITVLCPAVARLNWQREFQKFSPRPLSFAVLLSAADAKTQPSADVTICSYDLTTNSEVFSRLSARRQAVLILDEAHFLKEATASRSKQVFGRDGLVHQADRAWCLTWTPAPNHPGELWILLYVLGVTKLTNAEFLDRYTTNREQKIKTPRGGQITQTVVTGGKNLDELRSLLSTIMLRRKKADVMTDLPKILFSDIVVEGKEPPREVWEMYFSNYLLQPKQFHVDIAQQTRLLDTVAGDMGLGADGMQVLGGLQNQVKSLRQWIGLQKVPAVIDLVSAELAAGAYDKIVIFGVHRAALVELRDGLKKFGAVLLFGGTPNEKRDRNIKRFQTDPKCRVFVGQTVAAGTAITLTAAAQVLFIEHDWVPGNNAQAVMRVHRIGQTRQVTCRTVGMAGSIDEKIQRKLKQKMRTLAEVFDQPAGDIFS
jgi:SWI/SNF-related matrix-associated actin-dependent regulator 1 of chromatin subfamily A